MDESDVIIRMSDAWRSLTQNDLDSIPHECIYSDIADHILNCIKRITTDSTGPRYTTYPGR